LEGPLYLVLTPRLCRGDAVATAWAALDGGVNAVQLRDKEAPDGAFLRLATELVAVCREHGVPLILNDRAHLVAQSGADGVHVGEDDLPPEEIRRRYGDRIVVGLSTHDRAEVAAATGRGADYVGLGPMFATPTKSLTRTPGGTALFRDAADTTTLPLFPIGGIDAANAGTLIAAGATRLAVSAAICAAEDPRSAAAELRALLP